MIAPRSLLFFYYNIRRKRSTSKGRLMVPGIANAVWSVLDLLFAADQRMGPAKLGWAYRRSVTA
jgi:hypothetical protein